MLKGEVSLYHLAPFDWFGIVCFANKNKNCQLSYSLSAKPKQTLKKLKVPFFQMLDRQEKIVMKKRSSLFCHTVDDEEDKGL